MAGGTNQLDDLVFVELRIIAGRWIVDKRYLDAGSPWAGLTAGNALWLEITKYESLELVLTCRRHNFSLALFCGRTTAKQ